MIIGFEVDWKTPEAGEVAGNELAWGDGILYVAEAPVWFKGALDNPQPISWSWIELLEFLSRRWPWLSGEQDYPLRLTPANPFDLRQLATRASEDNHLEDKADEEIFHFEGRHDLARGMHGIRLPSVIIVREGNYACVAIEGHDKLHHEPINDVLCSLQSIAETIVQKLVSATHSERARDAITAWNNRDKVATIKKLQLVTGLDLNELKSTGIPVALSEWELSTDSLADSELAAAARFVRSGPREMHDSFAADRKKILEEIRKLPALRALKIDDLSSEMEVVLREFQFEDAYQQGYQLALALRSKLRMVDDDTVADPEQFLKDHNIEVRDIKLSSRIDGIGCWGPRHGPVIFVNYSGKRSQEPHGRRATLAHEICHLLVDRRRALPLAEVMGGRSPYIPERRANAFAAEFLVPRYLVAMCYRRVRDIQKTIDELKSKYHVGIVLVANQLHNYSKGLGLTAGEESLLKRLSKTGDEEFDY